MLGNSDPNSTVKVILQADDIRDAALASVLAQNGVSVASRASNLGMMMVEMPLKAAEAVANARGMRHLSLNREIKLLGHIETTTGASLARSYVSNNTGGLNGAGIGIAVVDSGMRKATIRSSTATANRGSQQALTLAEPMTRKWTNTGTARMWRRLPQAAPGKAMTRGISNF